MRSDLSSEGAPADASRTGSTFPSVSRRDIDGKFFWKKVIQHIRIPEISSKFQNFQNLTSLLRGDFRGVFCTAGDFLLAGDLGGGVASLSGAGGSLCAACQALNSCASKPHNSSAIPRSSCPTTKQTTYTLSEQGLDLDRVLWSPLGRWS